MVIKEIFSKFISDFDHFLGSWEEGFRNEFIVNLYTRKYKENERFVNAGHEMDEIILITGGCANMISREGTLFMILPKYGVYGDYVAAFGLKSLAGLKGPPNPNSKVVDPKVENFTCLTMNCDKEVF